ncbi:DUF4476 domain-containing protein [Daejeonella sp.]|uniref:DUF4476 domain-containing protein n=1 Tax=Daejeonella sp. TaxID=2805397 RepID=UPI0030C5DE80
MKTILSTLLVCFLAATGIAQTTSTVNIIFRGITKTTNNYEVRIDDRRYFSNTNANNTATVYKIEVGNILTGTRGLKVYKLRNNSIATNASTQNTLIYSNSFVLREGYDMNINVRANGSVQFDEEMSQETSPISTAPMATATFNSLKQSIQSQGSQSVRAERIRDAFINTDNRFTSAQIRQLLVMVTSESDKLDLAKLAYSGVTDPANYAALSNVFSSTARRNEFADFIQMKGDATASTGTRVLISDANFNTLVTTVRNKWSQSLKGEAVRDAFINSNNYYTTTQVRQLMGLVTSETDRMDLIKLAYPVVSDTNNYASLYDVFVSTAHRAEFNDFVVSKGGVAVNTGVKAQMTTSNFLNLRNSIQAKWSQALKTDAVRDAFANTNYYFSTAQIRELLTMVTSESDRLELAKQSFRSVMDPAVYYQLGDLFTSSTYRTEFNNYASAQTGVTVNAGTTTTVRTPMSASDFSVLVFNVRSNLLQLLKVQAERDVFANPNNFFTTAQVKQLIGLINSEPNRLELAKLSYKTVTDPQNFTQVNDLFNLQTSKDELAAYVSTNRVVSN